jgi:hypothetical protein
MPNYRVLINDNAHYMDESERADHGVFANADEAVAACKEIVDDELKTMWKSGTTAKELYRLYVAFGPDPFIVPLNPSDPDVRFSAWTYAKGRNTHAAGTNSFCSSRRIRRDHISKNGERSVIAHRAPLPVADVKGTNAAPRPEFERDAREQMTRRPSMSPRPR